LGRFGRRSGRRNGTVARDALDRATRRSGDPDAKAGLKKSWADRRNWSATVRWREEGISMMTTERFEKAADFIDKAVARLGP
jgi:hypothetical protein